MDQSGSIPLYHQVFLYIRNAIHQGLLAQQEKLPSETVLTKYFDVSQITIKRALNALAEQGYVERRQGVGTIVTYKNAGVSVSLRYNTDMKSFMLTGDDSVTRLLAIKTIPARGEVAEHLGVKEGEDVTLMSRVRLVDEEPKVLVNTYLTVDLADKLNLEDIESRRSLTSLLLDAGVTASTVTQDLSAMLATAEIAKALHIVLGAPIAKVSSRIIARDGSPSHYVQVFFPPERYRYEVFMQLPDYRPDSPPEN